jgi:LL-H family phage holin
MTDLLTPTLITNIILALLPFVTMFAYYLYGLVEQRLPKNQADMLERVVTSAVYMVEQQYPDVGGAAKKKLAENVINGLIRSLGLPVPTIAAIDAALEASVFRLQQMPSVLAARQAKAVGVVGQAQRMGQTEQVLRIPGMVPTEGVFRSNVAYAPMAGMNNAMHDDLTSAGQNSWSSGPIGIPVPNAGTSSNMYMGNTVNPNSTPNAWGMGNV